MLVGDALSLMDKLGIKRAHWVGESSGGILGIVAALTHPERLNSLVLVNTPFKLPGAVMETYNVGEEDHASAIEKYGVGGWCRKTLGYRLDLKKAPPAMQEWVIREMGKVANHVGIAHHLMAAGGDMTKRITEIKMPILIMFLSRSGSLGTGACGGDGGKRRSGDSSTGAAKALAHWNSAGDRVRMRRSLAAP